MKKRIWLTLTLLLSLNFIFAQSASGYISYGIKLHDSGDYKGAIKQYKKALKTDKSAVSAHYEIAFSYLTMKKYKKAIKHADKLINMNPQPKITEQAYDVKGTSLDDMGKPYEAIEVYKEGIKYYPDFYLLHFNLGLTLYKTFQFEEAEKCFINAITINPDHGTSHLLLAYAMDEQNKRVQSILSCYYFLMLENKTSRSTLAYKLLRKLLRRGVSSSSDGTSITISLNSPAEEDPFRVIDVMISMSQALNKSEISEDKSPGELFYRNTETLFKVLKEQKAENNGFWWDFYASYFEKVLDSDHLETYCYYVCYKSKESSYKNWLKDNPEKVKTFKTWRSDNKVKVESKE